MGSNLDQDYLQTVRGDLAALCCAGAFTSQAHIWPAFVEWVMSTDPSSFDGFRDLAKSSTMMESVLRIDHLAMISLLLTEPADAEIAEFLEDSSDT